MSKEAGSGFEEQQGSPLMARWQASRHGGKASVATLHRTRPEATALSHDFVTETYYILAGSGTIVTGGSLGSPRPMDLSRFNAGMSQSGARVGGESRKVKPGDIIIIPAGTPHGFSELDGPISYLVYRFEPAHP